MSQARKADNKKKRLLKVRWLAIVIIVMAMVIWALSPVQKRIEQRREITGLKNNLKEQENIETNLKEEIVRLTGDGDYIEEIAREKLGMIMPGEDGYIVIENKQESKADDDNDKRKEDRKDNSWLSKFFRNF